MKTKDIVTISTVALGTAALTVTLFMSTALEADNEGEWLAAKIPQPKLVSEGVELTLAAADGRTFQAGDKPEFAVRGCNTTDQPVTANFQVAMTGTSPADALSRVAVIPSMLWQQPLTITLKAGETKTIGIDSQTKLPANQLISVSLQAIHSPPSPAGPPLSQIVAMNFSTVTAPSQPILASARQ